MFCEINVQSAAHITLIHNPRPTIYLFISFSIFLTDPRSSIPDPRSPIPYPRSSILDPRFPVNLEVLLIKMVLFFFFTTEFISFSKEIRKPTRSGKAPYAISILWLCSAASRLRDSQVQRYPNKHIRGTYVTQTRSLSCFQ